MTAKWFIEYCLPQLQSTIEKRRPKVEFRGLFPQINNASVHTAHKTIEYLQENKINAINHPPNSYNLVPCDFYLFLKLKASLRRMGLNRDNELGKFTAKTVQDIAQNGFFQAYEEWIVRYLECIITKGAYLVHLY